MANRVRTGLDYRTKTTMGISMNCLGIIYSIQGQNIYPPRRPSAPILTSIQDVHGRFFVTLIILIIQGFAAQVSIDGGPGSSYGGKANIVGFPHVFETKFQLKTFITRLLWQGKSSQHFVLIKFKLVLGKDYGLEWDSNPRPLDHLIRHTLPNIQPSAFGQSLEKS